LSTESISPEHYYYDRGFGYKRFRTVEPNPLKFSLVAYSHIPSFDIRDEDYDNYPLIIEITKELLGATITPVQNIEGVEVYQIAGTVYLSPRNTRILHFSQKAKNNSIIMADPSIETKLVETYKSGLDVIDIRKDEVFDWTPSYLESIKDFSIDDVHDNYATDIQINRVKGFIYAYLIGTKSALPDDVVILGKQLKNVSSSISQIDTLVKNLKVAKSGAKKSITDSINRNIANISEQIQILKLSFNKFQTSEKLNIDTIIKNHYLSDYDSKTKQKLLQLFRNIKPGNWSFFEQLEWYFNKKYENNHPAAVLLGELQNLIQTRISQPNCIDDCKIILEDISTFLASIETKSSLNRNRAKNDHKIALANMRVTAFSDPIFKKMQDTQVFQSIVNELIGYPIEGVDHFIESKSDIALQMGKILKEYNKDWSGSDERTYINGLLDNIESYKPFDIRSHPNHLLQSLAAFLIKGDDPEKLIDYLIANGMGDHRISLGIWGATFGFAALPKTLTRTVFDVDTYSINEQYYLSIQEQLHQKSPIPKPLLKKRPLKSIPKVSIVVEENTPAPEPPHRETQKAKIIEPLKSIPKVNIVVEENAPAPEPPHREAQKAKIIEPLKTDSTKVHVLCPLCNSEMVVREKGPYRPFYGCKRYPECKGTRPLKEETKSKSYSKAAAVIIDYVDMHGLSKLSDIAEELKTKRGLNYTIKGIEDIIKDELLERFDFEKIGRSQGVKVRSGWF
jgi:hypothetical protein